MVVESREGYDLGDTTNGLMYIFKVKHTAARIAAVDFPYVDFGLFFLLFVAV